jgi:hypothetical protein
VHGPPGHGQDWLVGWLARKLSDWEVMRFELQARFATRGPRGVWPRLASHVGLGAKSPPQAIVTALFARATHQPILLVVRGIDRDNWQELVDVVWTPIRDWCRAAHAPHRPLLMLALTSDDPIQGWGYQFASVIAQRDTCSPAFVAIEPVGSFQRADIERWATDHRSELPMPVRRLSPAALATQIADAVPGLTPEQVLVEVCELCGINLYDQEHLWMTR